ncbi:uncharacterized protein MYCFIDRAFT_213085 [Pseudocercospora fijiensis CIRAD86]|uniref:SAP domain-containing protein n=1 Tax=Pseudocercospora fijiensis (strain CIRAD86) TaxID=383855 RepID=N1Q6H0_PSEFD|nr:uncharacterized protein MYCFIDRAFT_213085 [Pseudocercospora fijiensis CIRAD86]EME87954.1 hypothetical protein MYCFIDRAFT_213085 [Pseudocercospora fijiensis CIRAD86]
MADYAKKKNDELAALCKERGLAHTGKKADLVKRLEDYDAKQAATATATPTAPAAAAKPAANEDEIDWDDEPATESSAKAATTEPAANAIAAGGQGQISNPQAVPNQEASIDPAQTHDLKVAAAPADASTTQTKKEDNSKYSANLAERTLQEEIEKRKARARRFGMPEDSDEIKALERKLRFGDTDLPGDLNRALQEKKRDKRGRAAAVEADDGGIRKRSRGRPGPTKKGSVEKPKSEKKANGGFPDWMSEADRQKAEARKAKFAAA